MERKSTQGRKHPNEKESIMKLEKTLRAKPSKREIMGLAGMLFAMSESAAVEFGIDLLQNTTDPVETGYTGFRVGDVAAGLRLRQSRSMASRLPLRQETRSHLSPRRLNFRGGMPGIAVLSFRIRVHSPTMPSMQTVSVHSLMRPMRLREKELEFM
jgi:hypothetical protein